MTDGQVKFRGEHACNVVVINHLRVIITQGDTSETHSAEKDI